MKICNKIKLSIFGYFSELATSVANSEMVSLITPWVRDHPPEAFAKMYLESNSVIFSHDWLSHLLPALNSDNAQAQTFTAYHFVVAAYVNPKLLDMFTDESYEVSVYFQL